MRVDFGFGIKDTSIGDTPDPETTEKEGAGPILQNWTNTEDHARQIDAHGPVLVIDELEAGHRGERLLIGPHIALDLPDIIATALNLGLVIALDLALAISAGVREERRRRRKRREKEERRREKKERKREKRDRKEKKKHKGKTGAVTGQWGQYGIINESHLYEKDAEFRTWLVEECKINPESLSKDATRKQFARFVEDYNTATLPHPKFYNMASYERQMNSLRNGMTADVIADKYDLNADMAAHTSRHKRPTAEAETHLTREQLQELRRVQNERTQAGKMKLLGMEIKGTMGVRMDGTEFE
ncbi:hypothetical protein OPQ81_009146 [Rhizoctonia solani]|nr:hypothetical protein OPQ81_009146 [Rhizoctonia solani]